MKKMIFVLTMILVLFEMVIIVAAIDIPFVGTSGPIEPVSKMSSPPIEPVSKVSSPPIEPGVASPNASIPHPLSIPPVILTTPAISESRLMNIMDTATDKGDFTYFISLVKKAGLEGTLSDEGPLTLFAPTDEFLRNLDDTTKKELNNKTRLAEILRFNIAVGKVMSYELQNGMKLISLHGAPIAVSKENSDLIVNGMKIIRPDIECSNGVIHGIDGIMVPIFNGKFMEAVPLPEENITIYDQSMQGALNRQAASVSPILNPAPAIWDLEEENNI